MNSFHLKSVIYNYILFVSGVILGSHAKFHVNRLVPLWKRIWIWKSVIFSALSNKWNLEKIRAVLLQYEDLILKIKTSSVPFLDSLFWLLEKSGKYSTKTGYRIGILNKGLIREESQPVDIMTRFVQDNKTKLWNKILL